MTIDQDYTLSHQEEIITAIRKGSIFIYPTDTIYGLGCDATNEQAVQKIREIKKRDEKPFSVVVPSREWITNHCILSDESKLNLLPGPYTLIVNVKEGVVAPNVSFGATLGVRIPDSWFTAIIQKAGVPFVSTSVNISGEKHMEKLEEVPQTILDGVDIVIYEGEKRGESSTKIDLTQLQ